MVTRDQEWGSRLQMTLLIKTQKYTVSVQVLIPEVSTTIGIKGYCQNILFLSNFCAIQLSIECSLVSMVTRGQQRGTGIWVTSILLFFPSVNQVSVTGIH